MLVSVQGMLCIVQCRTCAKKPSSVTLFLKKFDMEAKGLKKESLKLFIVTCKLNIQIGPPSPGLNATRNACPLPPDTGCQNRPAQTSNYLCVRERQKQWQDLAGEMCNEF